MQFNSVDFMIFFPIVVIIYYVIPPKLRMYWLLGASYYFYMNWNAEYSILIGGSTIITYLSALLISRLDHKNAKAKKTVLVFCILINLSILALFKYGDFGIDTFNMFLTKFHKEPINMRLNLLLPVGISFYTFQALGYLIDVYRGDVEVETNFFRYALFVSFFPQLVAGPIERSKNLLKQMRNIENIKLWDINRIRSGAILMIWGLFMKMVIADRISLLVDTVFNNYGMYGSGELVTAAIGFTLQIYCDFGSYSMMAKGTAKILGFTLMENFNAPYFAQGIRDFWGRWHISLSTWFRDYLYIPLGGNRKGKFRKAVNTMIVFLVSGLWHGADWSFVAWGGIHGIFQISEDVITPVNKKILEQKGVNTKCFSWQLLKTAISFILVSFAWIFFRADTITDALRFIKRIFVKPTPWVLSNGEIYKLGLDQYEFGILFFSLLLLFLVDLIRVKKGILLDEFLCTQNLWFEWMVIICIILMIFIFGEYGATFDAKQFIYFQF